MATAGLLSTDTRHDIAIDRVSKRYGELLALDRVSLTIAAAQTTAIVGPSGCGKSTLLQMINGLRQADQGRIEIDGEILAGHNLTALRRRIGYCVQHVGLFPHMTVAANITLLAKIEAWSAADIQQRLDALLALTALEPQLLSRYPHQLSGGQQQRSGICRALMLKPDFLLLDEPFAAVDPITRIDIHQQYQQLQHNEPRTTVLVTHDIKEALQLADSIAVMHQGKVICHHSSNYFSKHQNPEHFLLEMIRHGTN